jgi:two-component system chemotaxis sensor kinase CheA
MNRLTDEEKAQKTNTAQKKKTNGNGKEQTISSIRVASEKIDHMMNLVSELVTTQARLSLKAEQSNDGELLSIAENVQKLSRQLRDNAFDIALVPVETMLTRFQRLVRDLSSSMNKKVKFTAEGTETELDKNIIETLTDPLLHILRNSIDHGIETPEERAKKGKPEEGHILLKAYYSGASVHIQIHDDGKGIDVEKVKAKAIEKGIVDTNEKVSQRELYDLIFKSGFSTSDNVTDVSGRGVGMDVVKRKLAEIRGEVEIDSEVNVGTTLTVKLPLTLSIIDGLLVQIEDNSYVVPLSAVDKIYAARHNDVVDTFNNLIVLDGEQVPFFYLREEFALPESNSDMEEIVVVQYEDKRIGLVVDTVIGEYQAVLKSLGKMYKRQDIISGATILGDGTVALVLDTNKMIDQFSGRKVEKAKVTANK